MRIAVLLTGIAWLFAQAAFAQTATFDIATFVPPRGWSRVESNGILILQDRKNFLGRAIFCQIYLFPNRPANATALQNFQMEWESHVVTAFGVAARPVPQTEQAPDGWTAITGFADFVRQGVPMRGILSVVTGFGKTASVLVTVSPNSYQAELQSFFSSLHFNGGAAGPAQVSRGPAVRTQAPPAESPAAGSLAEYIYTPPPMWTQSVQRDQITLTSQTFSNGERCQIVLLPMRPSNRPVDEEALTAFRGIFQADALSPYPAEPAKLFKGTSPQGWDYFLIRKLVGGQEGDGKGFGTILLAAKVGGQLATVIGTSKDFIVSNCFGELVDDRWPAFFYSLQFKNAPPAQASAAIQQQLAGEWISAGGSVGLSYTFLANGRYASAAARQYRSRVSSTEVEVTTDAFFGDGSYSFEGNTIVLTRNDGQRTTSFLRLHQQSRDNGRTWAAGMCLLDPGASGEVCYRKQ